MVSVGHTGRLAVELPYLARARHSQRSKQAVPSVPRICAQDTFDQRDYSRTLEDVELGSVLLEDFCKGELLNRPLSRVFRRNDGDVCWIRDISAGGLFDGQIPLGGMEIWVEDRGLSGRKRWSCGRLQSEVDLEQRGRRWSRRRLHVVQLRAVFFEAVYIAIIL